MKHIRASKVIDRNAPELVDLFDHLRDTLLQEHGITKARYLHLAPGTGGVSLKVSASPPLRPLASDFVENRRHELLYDLAERLRQPEPARFGPSRSEAGVPDDLRAARLQYQLMVNELIGEGWWHGFDVPTFGPCGRRGLFLINAPIEQPLTHRYMCSVRRELQDFHTAYCSVELARGEPPALVAEEQALLRGLAAGMRMKEVARHLMLTERGAEDRLKRVRDKLQGTTTIETVAKATAAGLFL